jgi:endonuclease III
MSRSKLVNKNARVTASINDLMQRLNDLYPDPKTELVYNTPFQLLVSVILSAQATDVSVNKAMEPLYCKGLGCDDILDMGENQFLAHIKSIGLAPTKAKNVLATCRILKEKYAGLIPSTRAGLESLPGVGRKTASVILGEIFKEPTIAVDTHVFRVTQRLGLHKETTPVKTEEQLLKVIPSTFLPKAHHFFILHGRRVCKAQKPLCNRCTLRTICPSAEQ